MSYFHQPVPRGVIKFFRSGFFKPHEFSNPCGEGVHGVPLSIYPNKKFTIGFPDVNGEPRWTILAAVDNSKGVGFNEVQVCAYGFQVRAYLRNLCGCCFQELSFSESMGMAAYRGEMAPKRFPLGHGHARNIPRRIELRNAGLR